MAFLKYHYRCTFPRKRTSLHFIDESRYNELSFCIAVQKACTWLVWVKFHCHSCWASLVHTGKWASWQSKAAANATSRQGKSFPGRNCPLSQSLLASAEGVITRPCWSKSLAEPWDLLPPLAALHFEVGSDCCFSSAQTVSQVSGPLKQALAMLQTGSYVLIDTCKAKCI